uniref:Rx N-terminal domain-containing protein n=2 Tax=Setaria TaxID=4554 RepID=K4A0M0_SETIT
MANVVSSVVVQETVSKIISDLVHKCEGKEKSNSKEDMERLEMAHIKLEAALEISNKWLITDAPLLRWRKKLKLTAQECDEALQKCRQRILEEEQIEQEVRNSTFPKRMAHATTSFIFSAFSSNKNELSRSIVQRFEWLSDGASEFLRFVELGGTPRRQMTVNSMIKHLFAGSELHHKIDGGNKYPLFLLSVVPCRNAEHGIEASLMFIRKDGNAPENDFFLTVMLQISESTDIIGITIKCLQLYTLHFKSTVESIRNELTQLPTQDLSWVPYADSCKKEHWGKKEHWDNLYSFSTRWFRPNPLCCKQHEQHKFCHSSKADSSGLQDVSLESVIEVNLQCQVSFSKYNKQRTSMLEGKCSLQDSPYLKVGLLFTPHDYSEDLLPADRSSAVVMVNGEKQHCLHTDMTLEQVEEIMLPKAIGYFSQNTEATVYQMLWKSRSGTAYIQVEKASIFMPRTRRTFLGGRKRKLFRRSDVELGNLTNVVSHFVDLWVKHAPIQLQASIMDWLQKEKEK